MAHLAYVARHVKRPEATPESPIDWTESVREALATSEYAEMVRLEPNFRLQAMSRARLNQLPKRVSGTPHLLKRMAGILLMTNSQGYELTRGQLFVDISTRRLMLSLFDPYGLTSFDKQAAENAFADASGFQVRELPVSETPPTAIHTDPSRALYLGEITIWSSPEEFAAMRRLLEPKIPPQIRLGALVLVDVGKSTPQEIQA